MLYSPPLKDLIKQAWSDFTRRLRWRIFFLLRDGTNTPYDPDYRVEKNSKKIPPKLPQWMELGLVMGRRVVNKTLASIPNEIKGLPVQRTFAPHINKILRFLTDNDYVITMTDKNLGLAVSKREWLMSNERLLLLDRRNYKRLDKVEADKVMDEKCSEMQVLSDMTIDHILFSELKLGEYFESMITTEGSEHLYPQFHGIPKIHKKPTGFRPIAPCHSVCFNPASKFISKELKPIIKSAPTIIHGSKDLLMKLSQLRIDSKRRWFFVSGDVVAFYPNVPLKLCIELITSMYEEWLLSNATRDPSSSTFGDIDDPLVRLKIFKRAIEIGNTRLIVQHKSDFFEQLNGLAMGISDAPDLANLFGAYFEAKAKILTHDSIIYYGRYIDDCLGLVYAESADEALAVLRDNIQFDNCTIEWAVSDSQCQFLDAHLYKDNNQNLQWRPFVKAGNHRERIPWVSHHPMTVKRGVYVGECSRLSVLCSNKENYIAAIRDLNSLFILRGYPEKLVMSWCKKNIQERWEKRFVQTQSEHDEDVLVLKSRYNDVWNWFSATELEQAVTGYWSEWYNRAERGHFVRDPARPFLPETVDEVHDLTDIRPDLYCVVSGEEGAEVHVPDLRKIGILSSKWIVSKKRNRNLFDLSTVWKKAVFKRMDENLANSSAIVPTIRTNDPLDRQLESLRSNPLTSLSEDDEMEIDIHRRSPPSGTEHPDFGRLSKWYT